MDPGALPEILTALPAFQWVPCWFTVLSESWEEAEWELGIRNGWSRKILVVNRKSEEGRSLLFLADKSDWAGRVLSDSEAPRPKVSKVQGFLTSAGFSQFLASFLLICIFLKLKLPLKTFKSIFAVWGVLSVLLYDFYLIKNGYNYLLNVFFWCRSRFNFLFTNTHLLGLDLDFLYITPAPLRSSSEIGFC